MSLYSIFILVSVDIILILVAYGYLGSGDLFAPLLSLFIGIWKIKKIGNIDITNLPFIKVDGFRWYKTYE